MSEAGIQLSEAELQLEIADDIASCLHDVNGHVSYCYPWGEEGTALARHKGPRDWQRKVNDVISEHLASPVTRYEPLWIAVASGHGIGKTAEMAHITKWALDTMVDSRVTITANTETQLRTRSVPEMSKWAHLSITQEWFKHVATSIRSVDPGHSDNWRADFTPWSKHNTEAFAGLHNEGKRLVLIFDEASAIDDGVWEVAEGAMTDEDTEIIWLVFGNPTRASGRFRECFRRNRKFWKCKHIDSREVEGTNKKYLQRIIEQYGEDSDQARIRVKGQFPSMSARQLFSTNDVDAAFGKHLRIEEYDFAPRILAVDPAWEGDDDFVIGIRQGLAFQFLDIFPKNNNDIEMANRIARYEDDYKADAVFIDAGYGTGIKSAGDTMGRDWKLVWFGGKAAKPGSFNKRAEMYGDVNKWLVQGGSIPKNQDLYDEMVSTETVPTIDGVLRLPKKADQKAEIGRSPDRLDCLAISFAYPVAANRKTDDQGLPLSGYRGYKIPRKPVSDDPYENMRPE